MATAGEIITPARGPLGLLQADVAKNINDFTSGTISTGTGVRRFYNDTDRPWTIAAVRASAGTAPTGATLIVDVNLDGTTIFTTQASRPAIAISAFTAKVTNPDVTVWPAGSYLTFDVDQVGSSVAGANLTVQITAVPA